MGNDEVVHLLPRGGAVVTRANFRTICECQRHSRRKSLVQRGLRAARRGAAVVAGVSLAIIAIDLPTVAMDLELPGREVSPVTVASVSPPTAPVEQPLPVFTTTAIRTQFLEGRRTPLTLEVFKEQYFSSRVPYGAIIYREARKNDLPPELVAAMVHTESDFRASLVSHKSAQGLMQIIPETARLLGIDDPFDPEENIAAGTRYFRYLLNRFDDRTVALAAYNAGEGNVARFGGVPPFSETRSYIAKVNGRTQRYRQRVHNGFLASARVGLTSSASN